MTPEEFKQAMIEIYTEYPEFANYDTETAHIEADRLLRRMLRELGYGDGIELFERAGKWYS